MLNLYKCRFSLGTFWRTTFSWQWVVLDPHQKILHKRSSGWRKVIKGPSSLTCLMPQVMDPCMNPLTLATITPICI